ncbi:MAG TPA: glycosyltransferase family 4 protein [Candidatus Cybelea sp.]|nr:glycosyltransferase family 4 protein [Candidatus Cybelea sp.]
MRKYVLLVPGTVRESLADQVDTDRRARVETVELAAAIRAAGDQAEIIDYNTVDRVRRLSVVLARRLFGQPVALAWYGFLRRHECDAFLTFGETAGLPLAIFLKLARSRPGHVSIAYDVSKAKTRYFFKWLKAHKQIDTTVVYSRALYSYSTDQLQIPPKQLALVRGHVDARFYRPIQVTPVQPDRFCSAGLAQRDYATLTLAATQVPDVTLLVVPTGHPLRLNRRSIPDVPIPSNVTFQDFEHGGLREFYGPSAVVCVPLRDSFSTAGLTTLLEAMAMGKPIIATRTAGLADFIVDGETGLAVAPGDVAGWVAAIRRMHDDAKLRDRLGRNARRWVEENSTLENWMSALKRALKAAAMGGIPPTDAMSDDGNVHRLRAGRGGV